MKKQNKLYFNPAFTIVELLVVIVVIGILAAVTIVSYTGISNKANTASVQLDLSNASTLLKMYYTEYGSYPIIASGSNCPSNPVADTKYCLKLSPNNTKTYSPSTGTNSQSYSLNITNTNSNTLGVVTNDSKPIIPTSAPLSPVADWIALPTGDHQGSYYDLVSKTWGATVTRNTPKTIYDPNPQKIYDVDANQLAINPRSDGKSGYEAVIESARTNYLLNSSFEAGTTLATNWTREYWPAGVALGTLTVDNLANYQTKSQRIQISGTAADTGGYNRIWQRSAIGTFAAGENATASAYIRGTSSGISVFLRLYAYDSSNNNIGNSADSSLTLGNSWARTQITYTNLPVNTSYVELDVFYSGIHNGDSADVYLDSAQIEKGNYATSYIPTTTSAFTRSVDRVSVASNNWNLNAGTVMIFSKTESTFPTGATYKHLLMGNNPAYFFMRANSWGGIENHINGNNGAGYTYTPTINNYFSDAMTWSSNNFKGYLDGALKSTNASLTVPSSLPNPMTIGSSYGDSPIDGSIQRVVIYSSALSDSDILTTNNTLKDGP